MLSRAVAAETELFADAVAAGCTRVMVISIRTAQSACSAAVGAFVVLNAGGWILTAAHLIQIVRAYQASGRRRAGYRDDVIEVRPDIAANKRDRKKWGRRFDKPAEANVRNAVAHEWMMPQAEFATNAMKHAGH